MEKETLYIVATALGVIILAFFIYIFTSKKDSETTSQSSESDVSLTKRLRHNKILLYIIGGYRIIELVYFLIQGDGSEQQYYSLLAIGSVLAIPLMIVGLLALISSVAGILLSLFNIRKNKTTSTKLLIVSLTLLILTFLWKYLIGFILLLLA